MLNRLYRERVGAERMLLIFLAPELTVYVGYTSISTHIGCGQIYSSTCPEHVADVYCGGAFGELTVSVGYTSISTHIGCGQIYCSTCPEHVADVYCGGAFGVVGIRPETHSASVRI